MQDIPAAGDLRDKLINRLVQKSGLSADQARKFLDAFSEISKEDEQGQMLLNASKKIRTSLLARKYGLVPAPAHVLSIPLIQDEDGTITVDISGYSALTPFAKPKPTTPQPKPVIPPAAPGKPRRPKPTPPGGYPGPSVMIKVNDWMGADLHLGEGALGKLRDALGKSGTPSLSKGRIRLPSGGEKLKGK